MAEETTTVRTDANTRQSGQNDSNPTGNDATTGAGLNQGGMGQNSGAGGIGTSVTGMDNSGGTGGSGGNSGSSMGSGSMGSGISGMGSGGDVLDMDEDADFGGDSAGGGGAGYGLNSGGMADDDLGTGTSTPSMSSLDDGTGVTGPGIGTGASAGSIGSNVGMSGSGSSTGMGGASGMQTGTLGGMQLDGATDSASSHDISDEAGDDSEDYASEAEGRDTSLSGGGLSSSSSQSGVFQGGSQGSDKSGEGI